MNLEKEIFEIALQDIIPNRFQPREMFDDEALKELSQSIKEHGVIQPIIVRKVGDKYEIIAGERRYRASQLAGKQTIPALVRDIDDKEAAKIALLENLQRSNLTPIEEAKTYQTILKLDNITQDELAQNLGKSQSTIANKLRLLTLDEEVQTALLNSQISERHARSLLGLDNEKQRELLNKIINEKLTVKGLDEEIMRMTGKLPDQPAVQNTNEGSVNMDIPSNPVVQPQPVEVPSQVNEPINYNQNGNVIAQPEPVIEQPQNFEVPAPVQTMQPVENQNIQSVPVPEQPINQAINIPTPQPVLTPQPEPINPPEEHKENIFDKLRINGDEQPTTPNVNTQIPGQEINKQPEIKPDSPIINSETPKENTPQEFNNIYDLRFAINNFRQAIQNTEKFGFKVKADEYDSPDKYQIVIEIDKKN